MHSAFEKYRDFYSAEGFADTVLSVQDLLRRMREMTVLVAETEQGTIVGTAAWRMIDTWEAHIRGMAVLPEWQGSDPGIAGMLLRQIEFEATESGCDTLTLETTTVLKRAKKFYRKNGFTPTWRLRNFYGVPSHEYVKHLYPKHMDRIETMIE